MTIAPPLPIALFGTDEPLAAPKSLRAGPLTAELEAGNLRHIRFDGIEIIRAISFIVRNKDWGTYNPDISDLRIDETRERFEVSYNAVTKDNSQELRYRATIIGTPRTIIFRGEANAVTDFLTNRTGFVILHPITGVAGRAVEIEHTDGQIVQDRFPELIDPVQPMMNLRSLTHEAAPALKVTCRMEGDTFEMEDQRNWTDASYKTYVRPLALPWPYTLAAGTRLEQTISLSVQGPELPKPSLSRTVSVVPGKSRGPLAALGLGLDPDDIAGTRSVASTVAQIGARQVICHYDPRRGHDHKTLRDSAELASSVNASAWLEAVVVSVQDFSKEIAELGKVTTAIGSPFSTILLSPAPDLKCTLPGSAWPPAPPAREMFKTARRAFPGKRIGGGMFSFFTEMNRKRPPLDEIDLVSFTTGALVHAGDDHSVMEGLESLPAIAASARAIAGNLPLAVGPSAIGLRMNPYGAAPMANPGNIRQAMNRNDPRQRGLLGAAWAVGYYAHFAHAEFEAITLGSATGPFGAIHAPQTFPAPWYDHNGGLYPVFHPLRGLAHLSGHIMVALDISEPSMVQGICAEGKDGREVWMANLTRESVNVSFPSSGDARMAVLDSDRFSMAAGDPQFLDKLQPADASLVTLGPYAVARILPG
jgi:D-apionolactonase